MPARVSKIVTGMTVIAHCPAMAEHELPGSETWLLAGELRAYDSLKHEKRRREWLTARWLLRSVMGIDGEVCQGQTGKPYIKDSSYSISISHSDHMVAVASNPSGRPIGIDCETISPRVLKVTHKFASDTEQAFCSRLDVESFTVLWSAKETLYKVLDDTGVDFKTHLAIEPFEFKRGTNRLKGVFRKYSDVEIDMNYTVIDNTVLVYTV